MEHAQRMDWDRETKRIFLAHRRNEVGRKTEKTTAAESGGGLGWIGVRHWKGLAERRNQWKQKVKEAKIHARQ